MYRSFINFVKILLTFSYQIKGDPGLSIKGDKGERGKRGKRGLIGPPGPPGELGFPGLAVSLLF